MCEAPFVCPKCSGYGEVEEKPCPVCKGERLIWPNPDLKNCVHTLKENHLRRPVRRPTPNGPYSKVSCDWCGLRMYRIRFKRHQEICLFNPESKEEHDSETDPNRGDKS